MVQGIVIVNDQEFLSAFDALRALAGPAWIRFDVYFLDGGCSVEARIRSNGRLLIRLYRRWNKGVDLSGIFEFVPNDRQSAILVGNNDNVYVYEVNDFGKDLEGLEDFEIVQRIYNGHCSPRVV